MIEAEDRRDDGSVDAGPAKREWETPTLTGLGDMASLTSAAVGTTFDGSGLMS